MQMIIYLVLGIVIGYVLGRWGRGGNLSVPAGHLPSPGEKGPTNAINPEQIKQKQEHLERVMGIARTQEQITNDEVEKALGVSDKTAERYLQELVDAGKLEQLGERGRQVAYRIRS